MLEIFRRRLRSSENLKQWFELQRTRACVPYTPCTSVLKFALPAVGENTGYGLLLFFGNVRQTFSLHRYRLPHAKNACIPHTPYTLVLKFVPSSGGVCGAATNAVSGDAGYGLLLCCVLQAIFAFVQFPLVVR